MSEELLIESILSGKCVLFTGAGASATSVLNNGATVPLGNKMAELIYKEFYPTEKYDWENLSLVSSIVKSSFGDQKLHSFLYKMLVDIKPSQGIINLSKFKWYNIYTTNIDQALETVYEMEVEKAQELKVVVGPYDKGAEDRNTQVSLHKLHGCIGRKDEPLVFSLEEYATSKDAHLKLFEKLSVDLIERPVLFIGYSMLDSNFQEVWATISKYCKTTTIPNRYFYVSPDIKAPLATYLMSKGFTYFRMGIDEFTELLVAKTRDGRETLNEYYSKNIAPVEVFNHTSLSEQEKYELSQDYKFPLLELKKSSVGDTLFYAGAEPTWKDIKNNLDAIRDIMRDLITDIDEWVRSPHLNLYVITGRDGDGKSTLLKRLSVELANRLGEIVLFADSRSNLDAKKLIELSKGIKKPLVILIDVNGQ